MTGLILDVITTENDFYGATNDPWLISFQIIDNVFDVKKWSKMIGNTPETIYPATKLKYKVSNEILNTLTEHSESGTYADYDKYISTIHKFLKKCSDSNLCLIGYNVVEYDLMILNKQFKLAGLEEINFKYTINLMELAQRLIPVDVVGCYSQIAVGYATGLEYYGGLDCIEYCEQIAKLELDWLTDLIKYFDKKISEENGSVSGLDSVYKYSLTPFEETKFSFGKYKGLTIEEVEAMDVGYLSWVVKTLKGSNSHKGLLRKINTILSEGK